MKELQFGHELRGGFSATVDLIRQASGLRDHIWLKSAGGEPGESIAIIAIYHFDAACFAGVFAQVPVNRLSRVVAWRLRFRQHFVSVRADQTDQVVMMSWFARRTIVAGHKE